MRSMDIEINGETHTLAIDWKASDAIAKNVFDPLLLVQEFNLVERMTAAGIAYKPRFEFGTAEIVKVLFYGIRAAGGKLTVDEVGDGIIQDGVVTHYQNAVNYIIAFSTPTSAEVKGGSAGK